MDVSVEDADCVIEDSPVAKSKKPEKKRLSSEKSTKSPHSVSGGKKRKMIMSPSTAECRSPKVVKITSKENYFKKNADPEIHEVSEESVKNEKNSDTKKTKEKDENKHRHKESKSIKSTPTRHSKGKKMESKGQVKPGALTKFLKKITAKGKEESSLANSTETHDDVQIIEDEVAKSEDTSLRSAASKEEEISIVEEVNLDEDEADAKSDTSVTDVSMTDLTKSPEVLKKGSDKVSTTPREEYSEKDGNADQDQEHDSDSDIGILSSDNEEKADSSDVKTTESKDGKALSPKSIIKKRKLTPKQLERKLESAKKREERERLRMEKEKRREKEREIRRREKEERRKEKEEKEKIEKEQKRKEKEQKELQKQIEIEQKQKEKEAKEEDRRKREEAREEERRRKEEEKLEAERKKQKAASNFASFFFPKKQESKSVIEESKVAESGNFMPFEVKVDMKVAPICRRAFSESEKSNFDETHVKQNLKKTELYLANIKAEGWNPRKSDKTWPVEAKEELDDVIIVGEEDDVSSNLVNSNNVPTTKMRSKLLQFHGNRRPPYWGTWTKKSKHVKPRRPFGKDTEWFDYEVDSDEEWEEEEPGESLRGSDDEKDEENPDDNEYDVDNDFMVPHGYLSDEEARADEEDDMNMSPETQKAKLKILGEQFEAGMNEKTLKLKPKVIGCIWQGPDNSFPENTPEHIVQFLTARQAWVRQVPVEL